VIRISRSATLIRASTVTEEREHTAALWSCPKFIFRRLSILIFYADGTVAGC
jgi:hypothetical protein